MAKIRHISRRVYPEKVWIMMGAPEALVNERYERNKYETNRHIKYWSTYFLLKSLTTTSLIQHWISQKKYLLHWLQMNENTFRNHLAWLKENNLCTVDRHTKNIHLCSYEAAAEILGIPYEGLFSVKFSPDKIKGKQTFQYLLRVEEFEAAKNRQLEALTRKLNNNPSLKNDLLYLMVKMGADERRLHLDARYFAWRMLKLQTASFREGTDILDYLMSLRADINRGVKAIKKDHSYRSASSVSYMKCKMLKYQLAEITHITIISECRSRFYIPAYADTPVEKLRGSMREGFKYNPKTKQTVWFLTDQVKRLYEAFYHDKTSKLTRYAA